MGPLPAPPLRIRLSCAALQIPASLDALTGRCYTALSTRKFIPQPAGNSLRIRKANEPVGWTYGYENDDVRQAVLHMVGKHA